MKLRLLLLFLILHLFLSGSVIKAQVTIGIPEKPAAGALLQLKNIENIANASPNATGGLGFPRVSLQQENSLQPCADETLNDNDQHHIGLVVYNLHSDHYFCPGLYVWNGTKWDDLSPLNTSTSGAKIVSSDVVSNSFIIPTNTSFEIPITKAFDVWEKADPLGLGHGADYLSTDADAISVEFIWQDKKNLFRHAEIVRNDADPKKSTIRLIAGCSTQGDRQGNAVVAVKIKKKDKTEDEIRWSWHVWISDYNPAEGGMTYDFNTFTWMDRNLGATNIVPGDRGSLGMYYQWGRKDPFPGINDWSSTGAIFKQKDVYLTSNAAAGITRAEVSTANEVEIAIKNPKRYIQEKSGNSPSSWYTNLTGPANAMPTLWGSMGSKSIYDPCPAGWRVPARKSNNVWAGITKETVTWVADSEGRVVGCSWPQTGFIPFTGSYYPSGAIMHAAVSINTWTADLNGVGFALSSRISKKYDETDFEPDGGFSTGSVGQHPAHAYSIRCVKE